LIDRNKIKHSLNNVLKHRQTEVVAVQADILNMAVGGTVVSDDVAQAFETAYPYLAAETDFAAAYSALDTAEAKLGLLSGVKGKLFEIHVVDDLNADLDGTGYTAELADKTNQSDWDIVINDDEGQAVDWLQAKATNSEAYIQEALTKYPDTDVIVTDEVYQASDQLQGMSSVESAGITNEDLLAEIADSMAGFTPPLIAFTVVLASEAINGFEPKRFAERITRTTAATAVGWGLGALTGTWWVPAIGSLIAHHVLVNQQASLVKYYRWLGLYEMVREERELIAADNELKIYEQIEEIKQSIKANFLKVEIEMEVARMGRDMEDAFRQLQGQSRTAEW
jgi:hypothetical protein